MFFFGGLKKSVPVRSISDFRTRKSPIIYRSSGIVSRNVESFFTFFPCFSFRNLLFFYLYSEPKTGQSKLKSHSSSKKTLRRKLNYPNLILYPAESSPFSSQTSLIEGHPVASEPKGYGSGKPERRAILLLEET